MQKLIALMADCQNGVYHADFLIDGNNCNDEEFYEKLIGEFNIYNILGIYAVAICLGQNSEKIKEYFNGKIGVLNMLLGEYLKKSNDKTINKIYLKNIILEQMKLSNELIL